MTGAAQQRPPEISVIIPTLNEAHGLSEVIARIQSPAEIIIVDGSSTDNTVAEARRLGAAVLESPRGRACQLNAGASQACGSIFLFLHADTWLPPGALETIALALNDPSVVGGAFARKFRSNSLILRTTCRLAEWRNRHIGWHFGDQAIFCRAVIFRELGGFKEMRAFEDVDFSRRLAKRGALVTLRPHVLSSARRFHEGPLKRTLKDLFLTARYLVHPRAFFAALLLAFSLESEASERIAQWRLFRSPEMPGAFTVTLSPRGRLLVGHSDMLGATIFDGYSSRSLALPEGITQPRVYESRSGQFWCGAKDGLYLYQRGQWTSHPIAEIQQEFARPRTRPLPIVPAEVNRVLFLTSDRLMEYDATTFRTSTLKHVSETGLGEFIEMIETSESGLLVSGARGVARVGGPLRHLNARTSWQEFLAPTNSPVGKVQRPAEIRDGSTIAIAFDAIQSEIRHLITASPEGWKDESFSGERVRLVWPGWAETRWGISHTALHRYTGNISNLWVREGPSDTYYDVAAHTNGVFWLATSSGLMRYAPLLWRPSVELSAAQLSESPSLAMSHGESSVWIAAADAMIQLTDGQVARFPWPEDLESPLSVDAMYELRNGSILISMPQRTLRLDPSSRHFESVGPPDGSFAKPIGGFRDGSVCIRIANGNDARLDRFDGVEFKTFVPSLNSNGIPADVSVMLETRAGEFWFGGNFGLARLNPNEATARLFSSDDGLFPERVQCLAEVGEEKLWAGGIDAIFELRGEQFERVKDGIERAHSILRARDGSIWISAANGVHRFLNNAWLSHGDDEGLPSLATHDLVQDRRGRLWLATNRGAVMYDPDADPEEPRTLPPTILERDTEEGRSLTIQFFGLDKWDYTPANRLLFSYRLDEGPWTPFTNVQTASFTNLGAGPHYIQSRAMDRNGNQDPAIATLEFSVTLPWSRDPRLLGVLILALCVTLFLAGVAVNRHLRLKRSYAEVERMVAERTAQLEKANQELLHSQKMRALGTLAAGIAHDFNNILSIIKGSAQIIESNPDDKDKVLTRVNRIQMVVEQGAGIVRSMLGLGKTSDQTSCDPVELVDETVRLLADRFPPEVTLRHEKTGTIPSLTCSKGVIHQILLNLILNAVDASNGRGTIILRTRVAKNLAEGLALPPAAAEAYLAIDIIDQGVGIPSEALPRIFEPFFTTKAFSSRRGTGLGLSMVYELAKGMGYGLAVQSSPNHGSTFTLLAPL